MQTKKSLIEIVSEEQGQSSRAKKILAEVARVTAVDFTLVLAATAISDLDGASAAGADGAARRLTPKLDAEALITGRTALGETLPCSPAGVTSPVVITRACLSFFEHEVKIVDCGSFVPPHAEHIKTGAKPGANIALADSMDISQARELFDQGWQMAIDLPGCTNLHNNRLPLLAECVPGGTTTALGVLRALGFEADSLMSGSIPGKKVGMQSTLAAAALARLDRTLGTGELQKLCAEDPLYAVSCLGDPMQAYAAGFVLGTLKKGADQRDFPKAMVLAGGSQMLAVYALIKALVRARPDGKTLARVVEEQLLVVTTKWVAYDPFANTKSLAQLVDAPFVAASPDFHLSRHPGLQAYEDGHVKEGVGAGASLLLASLLGGQADERTIIDTIDQYYDKMILS